MKEIVKGSFLKSLIPLFAAALIIFPANVEAGVLESLDNELTSLVALAEPFLVTVECRFNSNDNVYVGSGFLIDDEGYIISTTTVVGEAEAAKIIFKDGASYDAQIVGKDYHTGLALLQIEPVNRQIPVIGDSYDIREGSWVFVIGNSFEIPNAVNLGVYSGLTDEGFLQLSVQTGPGGSGSAVFNTKGELIGILVAQASETVSLNLPSRSDSAWISKARGPEGKTSPKTSETLGIDLPSSGISLALPAAKLESIVNQLKETGEAKHGFFGIRQKALSAAKKEEFGLTCGVEIVEVLKGR
jgi:S1-C subfamily serine protease